MIDKVSFVLKDEISGKTLRGRMRIADGTLLFAFEGYGEKLTYPSKAEPVMIEYYEERLVIRAWNDIDSEDSVDIDMEEAREGLFQDGDF